MPKKYLLILVFLAIQTILPKSNAFVLELTPPDTSFITVPTMAPHYPKNMPIPIKKEKTWFKKFVLKCYYYVFNVDDEEETGFDLDYGAFFLGLVFPLGLGILLTFAIYNDNFEDIREFRNAMISSGIGCLFFIILILGVALLAF